MSQSADKYVKKVYSAWLEKNMETITSSLRSGYKYDVGDIDFFCGPMAVEDSSISALDDYLSVADAIDIKTGGITAYTVFETYFPEKEIRRSKVFIVVCCPSMSGKTQFALTLPRPTIYIPLVQTQDIYKNFTPLFKVLREAAYRDLAYCYEYFANHKEATFDPALSATNAGVIFSEPGAKSYVLGFFAYVASKIHGIKDAAASTRAIVDYMRKMTENIKIKPVSLEYFSKIYFENPFCVVLDEFPPDGQSQIVALFIRNILRSRFVALMVMSTSALITNMVSPGNLLVKGTGDSRYDVLWAIVIRLLPGVNLVPLLARKGFRSLEGLLNFLRQVLLKGLTNASTLDAFIKEIKTQLTSSRPGICRIIIDSLLEMTFPGLDFEDLSIDMCLDDPDDLQSVLNLIEEENVPMSILDMFTSFIRNLQNFLFRRKSMMFISPGFFGSLSLIFPNFHIDSDLFGPTSTAHINHHLYYLADPQLRDRMNQAHRATLQPISFKLYIRMLPSDEMTAVEGIVENELSQRMQSKWSSFTTAVKKARSIKMSTGNPETFLQVKRTTLSPNPHPETQPKKPHLEAETTVVKISAASSRVPLYFNSDCRRVDKFYPKSEIPSIKEELFCYLGTWYIRNSFIITGDYLNTDRHTFSCLINTIHSRVQDYVSKVTAIAPGNQRALNNDGTVAEALAVQCVVFSSHVFAEYDQNGIRFLYRVLRNCDIESTSTSITEIDEIGDNMQNFEAVGPSGRLIIESAALATKMSQIRVPYLGPIECTEWSNLNQILPNTFGNVFRPPSKRDSTGYGMDFEFEYFSEQGCKRAEVEVKDFRTSLGISDLRKIIRRISRDAELHFLFCGPVARTLSSSKNMASHLVRDLKKEVSGNKSEKNDHDNSKNEGEILVPEAINVSELGPGQSTKDVFMPHIGEAPINDEDNDSGDEVDDPNETLEAKVKKNTESLLSVLRSKRVNLYYVKRSLEENAINFTVLTLYESSDNDKSSIIIPFIPVTADDISMREKAILLEREYNMLTKRLPSLFYPGGLTTIGELVAALRDSIREQVQNQANI